MRAEQRDALIREMFESDMELLKAKGHDYAGEEDCLTNLRQFGFYGIVVRLADKFSRLQHITHLKAGGYADLSTAANETVWFVRDESIEDTLRDISNYCYLARLFLPREK